MSAAYDSLSMAGAMAITDDAERSGAAEVLGGFGGRKPPKMVNDAERSGAAEVLGGFRGRKPPKVVELDEDDLTPVPDPPASGVKSLVVASSTRGNVADRERAFRALYEAHSAFVWRNLRRLGVPDSDVEDKLQEVFVVAHRRWEEFVDRGHGPRAWLFQIALRVASDARRHKRRHPVDPDGGVAQERQSIEAPQTAAIDKRQQLDLLDRALSAIDMGRRAVLVLHEIEQMTAPEIARTLDIPLNTVYSRLRVARIELEQELRQLGGGK